MLRLKDVLPVVVEYRPAVIWLFAAKDLDQYGEWATTLREVSLKSEIWVQAGSVAAALHVARIAKADASCLQGADTAGHAGIISLMPEACNALVREGLSHISVLASGGIVDRRSVAAALVLVAQGVVIGKRFLASHEVMVPPEYKAAVLEAQDGGQVTTRSKLFDQLRDPDI
jgi:nitronate monooxygenase